MFGNRTIGNRPNTNYITHVTHCFVCFSDKIPTISSLFFLRKFSILSKYGIPMSISQFIIDCMSIPSNLLGVRLAMMNLHNLNKRTLNISVL